MKIYYWINYVNIVEIFKLSFTDKLSGDDKYINHEKK